MIISFRRRHAFRAVADFSCSVAPVRGPVNTRPANGGFYSQNGCRRRTNNFRLVRTPVVGLRRRRSSLNGPCRFFVYIFFLIILVVLDPISMANVQVQLAPGGPRLPLLLLRQQAPHARYAHTDRCYRERCRKS